MLRLKLLHECLTEVLVSEVYRSISFSAMYSAGYLLVWFGLGLSLLTQLSASSRCRAFCQRDQAGSIKQYGNDTTITFCQLWGNKDALIDPAIELGIQTLRETFPPNVHFEWVKMELQGGCSSSEEA